jgi:two-component system, LytTR family, sensor kinase
MIRRRLPATPDAGREDPARSVQLWGWPRIWLVSVGVCTVIAVLQVTHGYIGFNLAGVNSGGSTLPSYSPEWLAMLWRSLPSWTWIGLVVPISIWLARRFPLAPEMSRGYLVVHLFGALLFAGLCTAGAASLRFTLFTRPSGEGSFRVVMFTYYALYFHSFFLYYWTIVGFYSMVRYYREAQARGYEKIQLEAVATKARLDALRRQLHPHFLFNILSAISSLVLDGDRRSAVYAITDLSQLLRVSFSRDDPFITLREEIEFLDLYVDLHRLRLDDRVRIAYRVDPDAADVLVPTFLLQPLVENAIDHGLARVPGGGAVVVAATLGPSTLEITVSNARPPGTQERSNGSGVGLANTRERIHRSYAGAGDFDFILEHDRAVARVVIPLSHPSERSGNGRQASYADRGRRALLATGD